jgi:hypothetical protein
MMKLEQSTGMKAIRGIVLMLSLVMVPFTNAMVAEYYNAPAPCTPNPTPEWRFGMDEWNAGVLAWAMGALGWAEGPPQQPADVEATTLQDMLDFQDLMFEVVFGRAYEEDAVGYYFEHPLDETTYGTVVFGWNTAGEPMDALVLSAWPIDVSDIEPDANGTTVISAAHIAGTLEGVGKQGFWGISMVYEMSEGERFNELLLLRELDATTEEVLMILLDFDEDDLAQPGYDARAECKFLLRGCINSAYYKFDTCTDNAGIVTTGCMVGCGILGRFPIGKKYLRRCLAVCAGNGIAMIAVCSSNYDLDTKLCYNEYKTCLALHVLNVVPK